MTEEQGENLNEYFARNYKDFSDAIFRYCYFQTSKREKALDLTQDTFIRTWEYLSSGKKVENLRAFLYKVARNLIIDDRRKKKSESLDELKELGFDLTSEKNEVGIKETEFEQKIALETINQLDEKYREVIVLRYVEDISVKDIAEILKEPENNVSVKIHRGLEKLKILLGGKLEKPARSATHSAKGGSKTTKKK